MRLPRAVLPRHCTSVFWALSLLLALAFAMGGGSKADIQSLVVLRPMSALLLGVGLSGLTREQIRANKFPFGMAAAIVAMVLLQLIPLPPFIWVHLPGRELIVEIDRAAGLGAVWRPVSLVPSGTWNALFALLPPLAALVLAIRLSSNERATICVVIIGLSLLSAVWAIMQLGGSPDSPLYLYSFTNNGAAVGLFANRNHQAVLLAALFPLLAAYGSHVMPSLIDRRLRVLLASTFGALLIPLILVTGSRVGVLIGILGILSVPFIFSTPPTGPERPAKRRWIIWGGLASLVILLIMLTLFLDRAEAISRILTSDSLDEGRYMAWPTVLAMSGHYFPVGTGFGSFVEAFKVHESVEMLRPTIFNHAHNDWLEAGLTGGLPALLLMIIAVVAFLVAMYKAHSSPVDDNCDRLLQRTGLWITMLIGVASISDYPLRVPSLACLFCVIVIWITSPADFHGPRQKD